ncbi:hypothetical protein G5I_00413 [Acromyrmex echinatior]|uniref:Uncharacterized protein n=1 Tax=Acromyrmex echinatior TaxID=103372 RepID=F4W4T8_ACREC|nr:hypothetical protein G5I_00413 [Acromyrmex echinatior]
MKVCSDARTDMSKECKMEKICRTCEKSHMAKDDRKKECCRHCLRTGQPSSYFVLARKCPKYFSMPMKSMIEYMRKVVNVVREKPLPMCMDGNAVSNALFSKYVGRNRSRSKEVEELPTRSTEKSFEQLLEEEEEEDVFDETFMGSIIDLIHQTWITNTFVKNLRMMIGCIQTYMVHQRKIDPNTYEGGKDDERCINVIFERIENERFAEFYVFGGRAGSFPLYLREQKIVSSKWLLDWVADDLRKVPSLMKEKKNVL